MVVVNVVRVLRSNDLTAHFREAAQYSSAHYGSAARRLVRRNLAAIGRVGCVTRKRYMSRMKLAVLTDVHANLPALNAALGELEQEGFDLLVHLGDAIAIGPFPAECLDVLLNIRNACFIMGNHDAWFVHGLPRPQPAWMSDGEVEHQHWTHRQIDSTLRAVLAQWPNRLHYDFGGIPTAFVHYPLDGAGRRFAPFMKNPTAADLDRAFALFAPEAASLNFYGHNHHFSDLHGRARYVNPGSLGCATQPIARYTLVRYERGSCRLDHRAAPYDDGELLNAFEARRVPERAFIYRAFFGGRFSSG
jgi:predicted phosphodiesterase